MAQNRIIGNKNQLPWHLPADLKYFKSVTLKKPIIMGRKTFESIGKPLPERMNIVISSNPNFQSSDIYVASSLENAIALAGDAKEIMIIGGAKVFAEALSKVKRLYITLINANINGDAYFPEINLDEWTEISRQNFNADDKNPYDYSFIILERINRPN
jgi:dihydrofolate reductase